MSKSGVSGRDSYSFWLFNQLENFCWSHCNLQAFFFSSSSSPFLSPKFFQALMSLQLLCKYRFQLFPGGIVTFFSCGHLQTKCCRKALQQSSGDVKHRDRSQLFDEISAVDLEMNGLIPFDKHFICSNYLQVHPGVQFCSVHRGITIKKLHQKERTLP